MFSKRSQLQINETIIVIFIFIIILVIGLVFFNKFNIEGIKNELQDNERLRTINMLNNFPNSPELVCSSQTVLGNCIDLFKLKAYQKQEKDLGFKEIIVKITYPEPEEFEIYSNQPNNIESTEIYSSPVSIYDPISDKHLLGLIEIKWYT